MATGDFNAMASGQFGGRLYDAIASFQSEHGLEPTGIVTPETLATLNTIGGRIFNSWGFEFLDHPFAAASLAIPGRFGLDRRSTQHGFAFENRNHSMSVDFSVFPDSEASLSDIYDRLTRPAPGRRVDMKVIRPTFFAIAGGSETTGNYSRYIVLPGGIAGFTASWNVKALPNGNRVAVVMANELYPRRMVSDAGRSVDLFDIDPDERQDGSAQQAAAGAASDNETPINAGTDAVSQAALEAKLEMQERTRLAAQAEADRKPAAEAEIRAAALAESTRRASIEKEAREAAADRLRLERLTRAASVARAAMADASDFIKTDRDDPRLLDHLQKIADLNDVLSGGDPGVIEVRTDALRADLSTDAAYPAYEARRTDERQRASLRDLDEAVRTITRQRSFLIDTLARDPTTTGAAVLLPLVREADAILGTPNLDRAQSLMSRIDVAITKTGLRDAFAAATATSTASTIPQSDDPDSGSLGGTIEGSAVAIPAGH